MVGGLVAVLVDHLVGELTWQLCWEGWRKLWEEEVGGVLKYLFIFFE